MRLALALTILALVALSGIPVSPPAEARELAYHFLTIRAPPDRDVPQGSILFVVLPLDAFHFSGCRFEIRTLQGERIGFFLYSCERNYTLVPPSTTHNADFGAFVFETLDLVNQFPPPRLFQVHGTTQIQQQKAGFFVNPAPFTGTLVARYITTSSTKELRLNGTTYRFTGDSITVPISGQGLYSIHTQLPDTRAESLTIRWGRLDYVFAYGFIQLPGIPRNTEITLKIIPSPNRPRDNIWLFFDDFDVYNPSLYRNAPASSNIRLMRQNNQTFLSSATTSDLWLIPAQNNPLENSTIVARVRIIDSPVYYVGGVDSMFRIHWRLDFHIRRNVVYHSSVPVETQNIHEIQYHNTFDFRRRISFIYKVPAGTALVYDIGFLSVLDGTTHYVALIEGHNVVFAPLGGRGSSVEHGIMIRMPGASTPGEKVPEIWVDYYAVGRSAPPNTIYSVSPPLGLRALEPITRPNGEPVMGVSYAFSQEIWGGSVISTGYTIGGLLGILNTSGNYTLPATTIFNIQIISEQFNIRINSLETIMRIGSRLVWFRNNSVLLNDTITAGPIHISYLGSLRRISWSAGYREFQAPPLELNTIEVWTDAPIVVTKDMYFTVSAPHIIYVKIEGIDGRGQRISIVAHDARDVGDSLDIDPAPFSIKPRAVLFYPIRANITLYFDSQNVPVIISVPRVGVTPGQPATVTQGATLADFLRSFAKNLERSVGPHLRPFVATITILLSFGLLGVLPHVIASMITLLLILMFTLAGWISTPVSLSALAVYAITLAGFYRSTLASVFVSFRENVLNIAIFLVILNATLYALGLGGSPRTVGIGGISVESIIDPQNIIGLAISTMGFTIIGSSMGIITGMGSALILAIAFWAGYLLITYVFSGLVGDLLVLGQSINVITYAIFGINLPPALITLIDSIPLAIIVLAIADVLRGRS